MIGFIKHMWNEYKKKQLLELIECDMDNMVRDATKLNGKDMKEKYGNVSKVFVELKWAHYCVNRGKDDKRAKQTCNEVMGRRSNKR